MPPPFAAVAQLDLDTGLTFWDSNTVADGIGLPLDSTRSGSVMSDRFDPSLRWYVPAMVVAAGAGFGFAAIQAGVTGDGDPFDTAAITLTVSITEPDDLAAARAAEPGATFSPVSIDALAASLTLTSTAADGTPVATAFAARIEQTGAQTARVTADLQGPAVIIAFANLRDSGTAVLNVSLSYRAWRRTRTFPPGPRGPHPFPWTTELVVQGKTRFVPPPVPVTVELHPVPPPKEIALQAHHPGEDLTLQAHRPDQKLTLQAAGAQKLAVQQQLQEADTAAAVQPEWEMNLRPFRPPIGINPRPDPFPEPDPGPLPVPVITYAQVTDVESTTLPLGTVFGRDEFRSSYTLTASGQTRLIVDINDLLSFSAPRSEYRELTSLGAVPDRYPSLRSLYFGQVSGTVVAVPAHYGILRTSGGCLARCDAVVDDSPQSLTGSRFEFTFTVAPVVDPLDLARLRADLATSPEAQGRSLQVALPSGLDPRTAPSFTGPTAARAAVVDGPAPHTLMVGVSIRDELSSPAITGVNLLLHQLAAATSPMAGQVAIRLDDSFPVPVLTSIVLSLAATADSDDVGLTAGPGDATVTVTNAGPVALRLTGLVCTDASGPSRTPLNAVLPPGAAAPLAIPAGATPLAVQRRLDLPAPMPQHSLFDYVHLEVQTIQSVQHPLGFNASAIDFAAAGIAQLDLAMSLDELPGLAVPGLTLTAAHRIDSVHVVVPIGAVVTGLSATVDITVTASGGGVRQAELHHDFLADPIAVLAPSDLTPPGPA